MPTLLRPLAAAFVSFSSFAFYAGQPAVACGDYASLPSPLAASATSKDPVVADAAIAKLRAMGPAGLRAVMNRHADAIAKHAANPTEKDLAWCDVSSAIDRVAAQKDAWAWGLYWYTDLEHAKAAAAAQQKPILSLRLLGTLDTDLSCANSRFFRTALYANKDLSAYLRDNFVLHWKSVRPVPKVTIDFGDGRVVERTVTGNSIHYVLDADGGVIDGIPGLYGPAAFRARVGAAADVATKLRAIDRPADRAQVLANWHRDAAAAAAAAWAADLKALNIEPMPVVVLNELRSAADAGNGVQQPQQPPTARRAAPLAIGKSVVEMPLVRALAPSPEALSAATTDEVWGRIAARHEGDSRLDDGSRAVMATKLPAVAAKLPDAAAAGKAAAAKWKQEDPIVRIARGFERSMAVDTVRNEYTFHRTIHGWLADAAKRPAVDDLNERVYAELFLTPSSDPWLGLVPADAYAAIEGAGVRK